MNRRLPVLGLFAGCMLSFLSAHSQTNACFDIESILVDACAPEMPTREGLNEMVRFVVGPNPLNTSNLSVTWATAANSWQGVCQNATTASKVAQLNASITSCGKILEPVGGVLPAGAKVILVTSADMDVAYNSFAGLQDTIYMIFQCGAETNGHFANYNSSPGIRTLTMRFQSGCTDQVSYDRSKLVDQDGNVGGGPPGVNLGDGATVNFSQSGTATYTNDGCVAPITPLSAEWDVPPPVCETSGAFDLNLFVTGDAGGTWSGSGVSGSMFNPIGLSGNVNITYKVGQGACTVEKTQPIQVIPMPSASWTNPGPLCSASAPIDLNTYLSGSPGGTWSGTGLSGSTFNPSGLSGSVSITYQVGSGACSASQSHSIVINSAQSAAWTNPGPLCDDAGPVQLSNYLTGSPGGTWSGSGVSGSTFNPSGLSGQIAITYSVGSGSCAGSLTLQVQVNQKPNPAWTSPGSVCTSGGVIQLNPLITGTSGGVWSGNGVSGSGFNPSGLNGNIQVTYTVGPANCQASSTQVIQVSATGNAGWTSPGSLCENTGVLNLNTLITGNAGGTWSGTGVSGSAFNPAGLNGVYAITYSSGSGVCQASSTQNIRVNPVPPAPGAVQGRTTYCNEPVEPLQVSPSAGTSVEWYSDASLTTLLASGNTLTPTTGITATYYLVQVKDGCRSSATSVTVQFLAMPGVPEVPDTVRYCSGQDVPAIQANGTGTMVWFADAGLTTELHRGNTYSPTGNFPASIYVVSESGTCRSSPAQVKLVQEQAITVNISPAGPLTLCRNAQLTLSSSQPSGNTWSTGAQTATIQVNQAGLYSVRVAGYCNTASDSVQVIDGSAIAGFSLNPPGGSPPLDVQVNEMSANATSSTWYLDGVQMDFAGNNKVLHFEEDGFYRLTLVVSNESGCTDSLSRTIRVFSDFVSIYIPNTFSPNNDHINDNFMIYSTGLVDQTLTIFNRWGQEVYRFTGLSGYWDGTFNGEEVEEGMYVYRLQARDILDRGITRLGKVLLIK